LLANTKIKSADTFESLVNIFDNDLFKVEDSQYSPSKKRLIAISKLSQSSNGALHYLIKKDGHITNKIFIPILSQLSKHELKTHNVTSKISEYFEKLPEYYRNERILELSKNKHSLFCITKIITEHYSDIPIEISSLLFEWIDKEVYDRDYSSFYYIHANFLKLPPVIREKLLLKLSEKRKYNNTITDLVGMYYYDISPKLRNPVFYKIAKRYSNVRQVSSMLVKIFDHLDDEIKNELLIRYSEFEKSALTISIFIRKYFDNVPIDIAKKVLINLSKYEFLSNRIIKIISLNYSKLDKTATELLFDLSIHDGKKSRSVAYFLQKNFNEIPKVDRIKLIQNLIEKEDAAGPLSWAIAKIFMILKNRKDLNYF